MSHEVNGALELGSDVGDLDGLILGILDGISDGLSLGNLDG